MQTLNKMALLALVLVCLASCDTYKRTASSKHLAKVCADKFPVTNTTVYLPGTVVYDTIVTSEVLLDSFACPVSTEVIKYRVRYLDKDTCISKHKTDTVRITERDSAALQVVWDMVTVKEGQLDMTIKSLEKAERRGDKYQRLFWWPLILLLLTLGWIFRKPILRLMTGVGF